jgi:ATP-dependent helicase/nuclease subunit A
MTRSPANHKALQLLAGKQADAVEPARHIWLSASAGTGKTHVLTSRVFRLLLEDGVNPENLLCITFTKAGAAEMAERINGRLASWVQLDDHALFADLTAIGAPRGPDARRRASRLFAKVLDAPGGGLQIMTIHSFCQSLLGSFPEEAGLLPGFKPLDEVEQQQLLGQALDTLVREAEAEGNAELIASLQDLSIAMGEEAALKFLHKCASAGEAIAIVPEGEELAWARKVADVSFEGSANEMLEAALDDSVIDRAALLSIAEQNLAWCKGKADSRGGQRAQFVRDWLALNPTGRALQFEELHACWTKADGEPLISSRNWTPISEEYAALALELHLWTKRLSDEIARAAYADRLARAIAAGKAFARHYERAKHENGAIDFDDMIRRTAALLRTSHMAEWIRYKLDRRIDHILVDEAQDTNQAQWDIVEALAEDYFTGLGSRDDRERTIFSVGDFKQAIYGFQGTAPERYAAAGDRFAEKIRAAGSQLHRLELAQSFRSTGPVLDFVNALIETSGPEAFGIDGEIEPHYSERGLAGCVELLAPVVAGNENSINRSPEPVEGRPAEKNPSTGSGLRSNNEHENPPSSGDNSVGSDDDEENWITQENRELARRLALHAKALIEQRPWISTQNRHLQPGDIMFLLRSRGELASLLVAQLHECGVPVAGVDRLKLAQPLVVQDLLAVIRFVLQPEDDLSLACILVSPIIGWTQERLLEYGYRGERRVSLWQHLRGQPAIEGDIAPLRAMLDAADFGTVYDLLEDILSGPIGARRKFIARLGTEVLVPIEEMLNIALQFQQVQGGGLQGFLGWFEHGEVEVKREGQGSASEVRVMTVHGAKGLQAPVVILADICSDPAKKPDRSAELLIDEGDKLPLLPIGKAEKSGRLAEICERQAEREQQEHMRLLYVAITRAEERLIMTGSLGSRSKGKAPEKSWCTAIGQAMAALGSDWEEDPAWGRVMRFAGDDEIGAAKVDSASVDDAHPVAAPDWLFAPAPAEQRPPRPLVPSRIETDDYGEGPPSAAMRAAAERGKLLHALFERVTDAGSLDAAARWLAATIRDPAIDQAALLASVERVVRDPDCTAFFGPNARAEVPLAALVGETVITGRVDRLVVEPGLVRLIDFKTGRQVPSDEREVIVPYLRQMAHYVAALEAIFAGSRVEASLLYTHAPKLLTLSEAVLAPYRPIAA